MLRDKRDNITIYKDTIKYCQKANFAVSAPQKYRYDEPEFADAKNSNFEIFNRVMSGQI